MRGHAFVLVPSRRCDRRGNGGRSAVLCDDDRAFLLRPALVAKEVRGVRAHGQAREIHTLDELHLVCGIELVHKALDGEHAEHAAEDAQREGKTLVLVAALGHEQGGDGVLHHGEVEVLRGGDVRLGAVAVSGRAGASCEARVDLERLIYFTPELEEAAELDVRVHLARSNEKRGPVEVLHSRWRVACLRLSPGQGHPVLLGWVGSGSGGRGQVHRCLEVADGVVHSLPREGRV
mmetsp:Transcript_13560/g.36272  ORF Transcript_13560/g.36272 Transcript_13560/m.36272 type:complete len:234 (-) Transcript_13560:263-964(-)